MIRDGFWCLLSMAFAISALIAPLSSDGGAESWSSMPWVFVAIPFVLGACIWVLKQSRYTLSGGIVLAVAVIYGVAAALYLLTAGGLAGRAGPAFWLLTFALWAAAWKSIDLIAVHNSLSPTVGRVIGIFVPVAFGMWLIFLWQVATVGFGVPQVLLPAPDQIASTFAGSLDVLWEDFQQTFLKAVLAGYIIGCGSGFLVSILVDRVPFLQRGLLPLGNLVSALPIIGIAPIMVMWFGFDWQSKAAVVVVMTFFPMLVNTVTGLGEAGKFEKDLMRSYAAGYWTTLFKLRLPVALPFIFNALKINSTLALIGAIVAEFFGTPIVGMGFRISTEVGRMNVDMVWAEIAVAALAGSAFYGVMALIERTFTFWHPSFRKGR